MFLGKDHFPIVSRRANLKSRHWYFSVLLLPLLKAGAASSPDGKARVIHTSSSASESAKIDFATFRDGPKRLKTSTYLLYFQSKLGNILVSNVMARKYGSDNIISVALNPGNLNSELGRHTAGLVAFFLVSDPLLYISSSLMTRLSQSKIVYPVPLGALTQLWAGTSPEGLNFNGKYLWPWAREGKMPNHGDDVQLQEEVWKWCEEQVKDV
jgi:NAD(P)-dependent dehydrogenase (short-subunit alcohol dehydrogenase family)